MILALIGAVVTSVGGAAMSLALFTDSDPVTGNTFSTGTIVLSTSPTSALVTYSNMFPGDSTGGQALTVSNTGTGTLRYSMTSTEVDPDGLAGELQATVLEEDADGGCDDMDGATVYGTGDLSAAGFGDVTPGDDSGDRTLAASDSEVLCFEVSLPSDTGNSFQNKTATSTFTFVSEQTKNNP